VNEVDRLCALYQAYPAVMLYRDGGASWEQLAKMRGTVNPCKLSGRQLRRIYSGDTAYDFTKCRQVFSRSHAVTVG